MEEKIKDLMAYFDEQTTDCGQRRDSLLEDNRKDEAIFEKIKGNVYDIFKTILSVSVKMGKNDPVKVREFFMDKAIQIPQSWETSYEMARQHEDVEKMQIERIKLDTIEEIKAKFQEVWQEECQ